MKTKENTLPSHIEEAVQSRAEDDFRKKAASGFLKMLFELSDRQLDIAQREREGKVKLVGWGTFKFPKDTKSMAEFKEWIERELLTKPNINWLLKNIVLEGKEDETLNDLKAKTKQSPEDIGNNQWLYPMFDKLRSLGDKEEGNDTMSVQQLTVLARIAKAGTNGVTTVDICESMATTLSSIQRQLGRLGIGYAFRTATVKSTQRQIRSGDVTIGGLQVEDDPNMRVRKGLDLIEEFEDPYNRKLKRWVLSAKGVRFFKQLNSVVLKPEAKPDVKTWSEVKFTPSDMSEIKKRKKAH